MQSIIKIYKENKNWIEKFIINSIDKFAEQTINDVNIKEWFEILDCLDAVYESDKNYIQRTPLYTRHSEITERIGKNLNQIVELRDKTSPYFITEPYISSETKRLTVTVIIENENGYRFFDINLSELLSCLNLIHENEKFTLFMKASYLFMGSAILFFAIFSVFFGIGNFLYDLYNFNNFNIEKIFKPVIAVTLGLAFFDLGKAIILHEVFVRSDVLEIFEAKSFITFLTSIIIALFIETLLFFFKASLSGFSHVPLYVALLIIALSFLLFVFSYLIKNLEILGNKKNE